MTLRDYQRRTVDAAIAHLRRGLNRICIVMPTGAGKTITADALGNAHGGHVLWLVHRREIADQCPGSAVTIQSLLDGHRPDCDLLIADECHHLAPSAEQWHAIASHYPRIVGLTATPQRRDGSPLGDLFGAMIVGAHYSELLAGGWLVRAKVFRPAMELESGIADSPENAWKRLSVGRRGFAFFSRTTRARKFADSIPRASAVWGEMPADDRARVMAAFRAGDIDCLANVQVLTEGVDIPEADACMLACGADNAAGYLQRVGRVLRPSPGKTDAIVIDLPGASHRWGLPHEDREYSLSGDPIRRRTDGEESLTTCLACGCTYRSAARTCPECGHVEPPKLQTIRIWDMPLSEAGSDAELTERQRQILAYRRRMATASPGAKRALYESLMHTERTRMYKPGWAAYQFKLRTGQWPGRGHSNA